MIVAILVIKPSTKGRPPQPKKSRFVLKGISITIFTRMWKALAWPNHFTNVWEVWAHKTSLTSRLFIKKTCTCVPSQESERSCICVKGIEFASFYEFSIGLWKCSDSFFFSFYHKQCKTIYTHKIHISHVLQRIPWQKGDRLCRDRIVVGFTTTCVISAYHH